MGILIIWRSLEGIVIHVWRWLNLLVTLALKFKFAIYHTHNFDLSIHVYANNLYIIYLHPIQYKSYTIT